MRIGLLGAGRIGSLHAQTLIGKERVDSVAVYDPISSRAGELADDAGLDVADSVSDLLASVDAAVIASSTDSHAEHLEMAAAAGVPAFCEKPISTDLASTDRAIEAVESAGIPVMMGFNRRFDPGYRAARDAVADGSLGTLMLITGHHHDHRPPPEEYVPLSGGQFKDQLIHDFDLLRFVSGEEPVAVHAAGSPVGVEMVARYGDTAVSVVTLWLASGAIATLCGVRMDPIGYDVRMEVFGTLDSIAVGLDPHMPLRSAEPGVEPPRDPYTEWLQRFGASYGAEMDAFLDMVEGKAESPCTVHDARAAVVIAEACRRSLDAGGPVELEGM